MKLLFLFPAILLLLFFSSCKKEDKKNNNCSKTMKDIAGSYSLIKYENAPVSGSFGEKPVPQCMVGDQLILKPDGTTQYTDAGVSCGVTAGTGSWSVSVDEKISIIAGSSLWYVQDATINSFDCSTLVMSIIFPNGSTSRYTLKK